MCCAAVVSAAPAELVYVDGQGVVRWSADNREVALFGANYSLPSACDYRAAGYVHADRKQMVREDFAHFARMGWEGLRLCFWGDWESCDKLGNLIANDHLDVLDYAIYEAKQRGLYILFTPITTYSAWWPDGRATDSYPGFSKFYDRAALGVNTNAIAAECNYLRQILEHINPYTHVALKDEPAIIFIEMINEPVHRSRDLPGSIAYINALVDAVRGTGCRKLLFHNVSQDFGISPAIKASKVQGVTFAWYPTGLNSGHMLTENFLRAVDDYPPMARADLHDLPKLVYEFDSADMNSGYMYPAMARAFRGAGAQFVAMFSYDMLETAPYNLGWQTHFLNLVYSPKKAVSAVIAAEVMRRIPRYSQYGPYPDNTRFGPFRVSYEEDSSELATDATFLYANNTGTTPPNPATLQKIAGVGSSPLVDYEGSGAYFLDRVQPGVWRLELFPDAVIVQDPFAQYLNYHSVCSRLVARAWPMAVRLPDLGDKFEVTPMNQGNSWSAAAQQGKFEIRPGIYLLSKKKPDLNRLPQRIGEIGMREFICPMPPDLPVQVLPMIRTEYVAGQPVTIAADVIQDRPPQAVTLYARPKGGKEFKAFSMAAQRGYRFETVIPGGTITGSGVEYYFSVKTNETGARFPVAETNFLSARLVAPDAPLTLFDAAHDVRRLAYTRIGDNIRHGIFRQMPATAQDPAALRLVFPLSYDRSLDDYTASAAIKDRIDDRRSCLAEAKSLRVKARSLVDGQAVLLRLVESDGTAWICRVVLSTQWRDIDIPLEQLQVSRGVLLPLGFPGRWNYWTTPAKRRGGQGDHLRLEQVEHLQISFEPSISRPAPQQDVWADIASIDVQTNQ